jgi:hypothetical protein
MNTLFLSTINFCKCNKSSFLGIGTLLRQQHPVSDNIPFFASPQAPTQPQQRNHEPSTLHCSSYSGYAPTGGLQEGKLSA